MLFNIAMYTRLSIEDKEKNNYESESITNQKTLIKNFIKSHKDFKEYNILSYSDDGFVGSNFERPAIKRLIKDVKDGKINCIIVKDLSRFGRDYIEVNNYLDKIFPFLNVRFISINDNYDSKTNKTTTTDIDIAFKNILYSYYSKDLSVKVKTGIKAKAKQGNYISAYAPFGYKKNINTKRLEIEEETAHIVKMIFGYCLKGYSYSQICEILNKQNVLTRKEFKNKLKGKETNVKEKWKKESIISIITNEVYIGNTISFKRKRIKCGSNLTIKCNEDETIKMLNTHKPIVSKEIFETVNKRIMKKNTSNNIKNYSIFAYKVKCGYCKYCLNKKNTFKYCLNKKNTLKDKDVVNKVYYCRRYFEHKNLSCYNVNIDEQNLKKLVLEKIKEKLKDYKNIKQKSNNYLDKEKDILLEKINKLKLDKRLCKKKIFC